MIDNLSKMNAKESCEVSSEISDSIESPVETNNNNSTMSDNFSWSISKPELGLSRITKSFAVISEGESRINESGNEFKHLPTSR